MGRRAHKPDPAQRRQVEAMAAYRIPEIDIAPVLGIAAIHGLRRPDALATAPRMGENSATTSAAPAVAKPHSAWPRPICHLCILLRHYWQMPTTGEDR